MILIPVSIAERPSATDRYSGITKNSPIITRNWKKNMRTPPVICLLANSAGLTSGSRPAASRCLTWSMNSLSDTNPPRISQSTGDIPNIDGPPWAGRIQPHSEERSTPKTTSPMPNAQSSEPSRSRWDRTLTGASVTRRANRKMPAPSTTSPAKTHRHDAYVVASPPISGPTATAIAAAAPTRP